MKIRLSLLPALCLALLTAFPLAAQERSLRWSEVAVRAHLDAAGTLHVAERQTIVFNGDWNGGYRSFRLGVGHRLQLERLARIDPLSGQSIPLAEAASPKSIDQVDQYAWTDSKTLRWRSRLPSDPPFQNTALTYEIDYTLAGILWKSDGVYHLDHNFVFVDREGLIERYTLDLDFDPAWAAAPVHLARTDLFPGEDVLVQKELTFQGTGEPEGVRGAAPAGLRGVLFLAALFAIAWLYFRFRDGEAALGRWKAVGVPESPDPAWLEENLFAYLPEEVGALWDRKVGPPEVAATLARLVAEGKLASEVVPARKVIGLRIGQDALRLRRLVPLPEFVGHERKLVDRLFFGERTEVDTDEIRRHYKSTGFDPASEIRETLESRLADHLELQGKTPAPSRRPTLFLFLAAAACFLLDGLPASWAPSLALGLVMAVLSLLLSVPGLIAASLWQKRVERLNAGSLFFLLPGLAVFGLCLGAAFFPELFPGSRGFLLPGLFGSLGLALIPVMAMNSLLNNARSRESAETIRRRQILGAGRRWLQRELRRPQPALRDEWFPYFLAFGLNSEVDRWFRSFGGVTAGRMAGSSPSYGGVGSSSGGGGGWTGGGGAFGGAGATGTWAMAATGMASGVAAPSSSGSGGGGGGGGGGSSGGGGGGGW